MNNINVQQAGGFPMETDTLDAMQSAYQVFNVLGGTVAPLAIISGCVINGNYVSNGYVNIENEIIEFRGGQISEYVIIQEEQSSRNFEDGETKIVYIKRWATFGESSVNVNYRWADFHRVVTNKEMIQRCNHVGFIQDYYGAITNIPNGWYLCDGTNGTPDLRRLFVVGYDPDVEDYDEIGKTGGLASVSLTPNQMPRHAHSGNVSIPDHTHSVDWQMYHEEGSVLNHLASGGNSSVNERKFTGTTQSAGGGSFILSINESGNGEGHENRPPFMVLAKIMYKG